MCSLTIREFRVEDYDDLCEDHSRIEKVVSLTYSKWKIVLYVILNLLTAFIVNLFIMWYPRLKLYLLYSRISLKNAKFIAIFGSDNKFYVESLKNLTLPELRDSHLRTYCKTNIRDSSICIFEFKLFKYIYNPNTNCFHSIKFDIKTSCENIHCNFLMGLNSTEVQFQKMIFGECDLAIRIDSSFSIFIKEVTDPFYIFQICSVILWFSNHYILYASVIVVTTLISLIVAVWETRVNLLNVQKMARYSCPVEIYRRNKEYSKEPNLTSSLELVPGDLFEIPEDGLALPCDVILVNGTVIVNESMLTGESTPVIKSHIPNISNEFDAKRDTKFMLYAGTKIVQKRGHGGEKVMGLVYSTAFNTEKGNLVRSILFPKEVEFKFKKDSIRYILFMACLAFGGFGISIPFLLSQGETWTDIIFKALDLITTTVPPALPACIGIGISYSISRLRKWGIVCINRERVNISGRVNMICFDKTGTLTEDHLDIHGFRPVIYNKGIFMFDSFLGDCEEYSNDVYNYYKAKANKDTPVDKNQNLKSLFVECMACCHGITKVNGKIIGDPIDVKMFEESRWLLNENLENQENYDSLISTYVRPSQEISLNEKLNSENEDVESVLNSHYELGIVRRFDFSSKLQRMSTIVKNVNEPNFKAFCKGSPEKIRDLCKAETIPTNFNDILSKYTMKGFRVLALAGKLVKMDYMQSQKVSREAIESNLIFLGLLIVQNKLKENTATSIDVLQNANLRMVMATGDNILTAISVSKECSLINPESTVYTCEISKETGENRLTWNVVENFQDIEDDKEGVEENLKNLNKSFRHYDSRHTHGYEGNGNKVNMLNFSVDSIDQHTLESRLLFNDEHKAETDIHNEINEEAEVLNIDVQKYPFKSRGLDDDFIIAVTGYTFETLWKFKNKYLNSNNDRYKIHYDTFRLVLQNGYIFARMSPEHKTILVESLREENFTVCMCGDGANDCGALRAADVGVSLSKEEASIAAHFTSNVADISCLIKLLREGKASLVSSIQTFKYMMIYSIIQFISVTLLLIFNSYLTDFQFLASDLIIIFPLAFLIARTGAYYKLTPHQPTGALISVPIISSILIQTAIAFVFQYGSWLFLVKQIWYRSECFTDPETDTVEACWDNTTIYLVSNMQLLTTAIAFSISKPFRKPVYSNYSLCVFIVISLCYSIYIIVNPDVYSSKLLSLKEFEDDDFKYYVLVVTLINFILSYSVEKIVIPCITRSWKKIKYRRLYKKIKQTNETYNLSQVHKIKYDNK